MKAKVKTSGKIVEVTKNTTAGVYSTSDGKCYWDVDLDFNLPEEKESAVLKGWVCRDKEFDKELFDSDLFLCGHKPTRNEALWVWENCGDYILIPSQFFPSLTWQDEPFEVEIIIKPTGK